MGLVLGSCSRWDHHAHLLQRRCYLQVPSLTLSQVLPKQPPLRDGRENTCPLSIPLKHTEERREKKKEILFLCYKIKGLDEHQGAPLQFRTPLLFPAVQPYLPHLLPSTARQKTTVLRFSSRTAVSCLKSGCTTKGQTNLTAEVWTDNYGNFTSHQATRGL